VERKSRTAASRGHSGLSEVDEGGEISAKGRGYLGERCDKRAIKTVTGIVAEGRRCTTTRQERRTWNSKDEESTESQGVDGELSRSQRVKEL